MSNAIAKIKNIYQQPAQRYGARQNPNDFMQFNLPGQQPNKRTPIFPITRVQFERIRVDVQEWRQALIDAENSYNPQRVRMQRVFQDTIINEHVKACILKRKSLTLQRDFKICDDGGNEDEASTLLFKKTWFRTFQSLTLDAILYGYNLISLGDVINDAFPNISFVRRQNINVDRLFVSNLVYSLSGSPYMEQPYVDYYIPVSTPSDTGITPCGYGLMYNIARAEIFIRNNTGQNADYNEVFGQPIKKGTTTKQSTERDKFEESLRNMGSNPYILLDEGTDTLELVETKAAGAAYKTYENFELRQEKKISKILLGHADALDSTPGKLGAQQGEDNPILKALAAIQTEDAEFVKPIINDQLIPRMLKMGFNIPLGYHFEYTNDDEQEEFRNREDKSNQATAGIMKTIKDAGGEATEETWKYFEDRTGIPGIKVPEPPPPPIIQGGPMIADPKTEALKKQIKTMPPNKKALLNGKAKHLNK